MKKQNGYSMIPFPRVREMSIDGGRLQAFKHPIHGLFEVDVTRARQIIREHKAKTGETLSFSAFVISCLAKAVDENKHMHAYRDWKNQLVIFDDVSVNTFFDASVDKSGFVLPHIIQSANRKSFREIHDEIRATQQTYKSDTNNRIVQFIKYFTYLPWTVRRFFYFVILKIPFLVKEYFGTVALTSVGMFGDGAGWGIPFVNHTLCITLGGISEKPCALDGKIEIRECLCVTISVEHGIIDGATAARFTKYFKSLIENAYGLSDTLS